MFRWFENWERFKNHLSRLDFQTELSKVQSQKSSSRQGEKAHESRAGETATKITGTGDVEQLSGDAQIFGFHFCRPVRMVSKIRDYSYD